MEKPRSLVEEIQDVLKGRIRSGQLHSGDQLPPLPELGREFNASLSTVRQALELMTRDGWIEKHQGKGTFVGSGAKEILPLLSQAKIALLLESSWSQNRDMIAFIHGMETGLAAAQGRCRIVTYPDPYSEEACESCAEYLESFDVICSYGILHNFDRLLSRAFLKKRIILSAGFGCTLPVHGIHSDWSWGMYAMLEHLHSLGHRKIALASLLIDDVEPGLITWVEEREQAFSRFSAVGKNIFRERIHFEDLGYFDRITRVGRRIGEQIAASRQEFTAVIGLNDALAAGVWETFQKKGWRIPEELSIAGIDNDDKVLPFGGLTTIEHPAREMGETAAEMIANIMKSGNPDKLWREAVKPLLITRGSTMPVPCLVNCE